MQHFSHRALCRRLTLASGLLAACLVRAADPVPVTLANLAEVTVFPERTGPATVISLNESRLSAELNARIDRIAVQVGDVVKPGSTLVVLDCEDNHIARRQAEAGLKSLETSLGLARQQLERARTLKKQRSVSEELLDQRQAEVNRLDAERQVQLARVATAKRAVEKCTVRAPFHAVVLERLASVGELANPGAPLIHLLDIEALEVSARVQDPDVPGVRTAQALWLEHQERRYPLTIRTILPVIDTLTRNREVRLEFQDQRALPGAVGRLVWRSPDPHVPAELVVGRDGRLGVFVERNGMARFQPLPGAQSGRPARTVLAPDTRVVVEGRFNLTDGDPIAATD